MKFMSYDVKNCINLSKFRGDIFENIDYWGMWIYWIPRGR